ncbi:MAG: radical SAM protein [Candidatus Omnitrophica bacterium]|nr:radical SAM protein [Candidatus Omnitrophota bacterium]
MTIKILFVYPNINGIRRIPLGISILSACAKKAGHIVELFDGTFYKKTDFENERRENLGIVKKVDLSRKYSYIPSARLKSDFKKRVQDFKPDLIAISLLQDEYYLAQKILAGVKKDTKAFIVAGGVMPTLAPVAVLKGLEVDAVMIGEGEDALVKLADNIANDRNPFATPNLAYLVNSELRRNELAPMVDLNDLPFYDYSIFSTEHLWKPFIGRSWRTGYIELTRGCPFSCSFCANPTLNNMYQQQIRIRSKRIDRFMAEAQTLKDKYKLELFAFNDENFLFVKDLKEFTVKWNQMIKLPFIIQTRVETISLEKLELLKKAGCITISIGIESGDEQFRHEVLNRRYSNKQLKQAFLDCHTVGIRSTANNMIGFPDETEEQIKQTIKLNRECSPDSLTTAIFAPYLGCTLQQKCVQKGLIAEGVLKADIPTYKSSLNFSPAHKEMISYYFRNFQKLVFSKKEISYKKAEKDFNQ